MARAAFAGISPTFIVHDVPTTLAFYRDRLGFEVTYAGPVADDIFFGIVRRDGAQIMFKAVGVPAIPNRSRDTHDGLRGFSVADPDGYVLFFGRPM